MNKKLIVLTMVLAVTVFSLSGCIKTPRDKAAENLIEKATGGVANVSGDTVNVNVEGTNITAGENVKLPEDFPKDIYLPENKLLSAMTNEKSFTVSMEVKQTPTEIYEIYKEKVLADGWKILSSGNFGEVFTITSQKSARTLSVTISSDTTDKNKTIVVIGSYIQ